MNEGDRPPQTPPNPADCPVVYPWDRGASVAEVQELLCGHGFQGIRIDGDYGSKTERAVKLYQKRHGLRIDGVVGPDTWASLRSTIKPGSRLLQMGLVGSDVMELQGLLRVCGYDVRRDGYFGEKTRAAIRTFQRQHQLRPDGTVNPMIWTLLRGRKSISSVPSARTPKQKSRFKFFY